MFRRTVLQARPWVRAAQPWARGLPSQPPLGRRPFVLGTLKGIKAGLKEHWEAFAQVLLNKKKAQNLNMIENTLKTGLSIEEKEKLYRKIGLVDSAVVDEVSSFEARPQL